MNLSVYLMTASRSTSLRSGWSSRLSRTLFMLVYCMLRTIDTINYSVVNVSLQFLFDVSVKSEVIEYLVVECGIILVILYPVYSFRVPSYQKFLLSGFCIFKPEFQCSMPINRVSHLHFAIVEINPTLLFSELEFTHL